jgi:serine/threonine protein phosphatase 1
MALRTYAIGDIHGHLDKLRQVHAWIADDRRHQGGDDVVVHIGDLVDRGPDSSGVVEYLRAGVVGGQPWVVLKGNHDRLMCWYLEQPSRVDPRLFEGLSWLHPRLGGLATLASYGVDDAELEDAARHGLARAAVPDAHVAFLAGLDTVYCTDGVIFVHAGIRPGVALDQQAEQDLVWIREPFLSDTRDHGRLVIHGHTVVEEVTHYGNRINIDTGAGFGGPLAVIVIEGREAWRLSASGREALLPPGGR